MIASIVAETNCLPFSSDVGTGMDGRYYYRCRDCLPIAVTDSHIPPTYDKLGRPHYAICAACEGEVMYLGRVENTSLLLREEHRSPCDGRCTSAKGPQCDCICGGKNHGTHLLVKVVVREDALPLLAVPAVTRGAAEEYRQHYKEAKEAWTKRYQTVFARRKAGEFLSAQDYQIYMEGQRYAATLSKARKMGNHKARMAALRQLVGSLKP